MCEEMQALLSSRQAVARVCQTEQGKTYLAMPARHTKRILPSSAILPPRSGANVKHIQMQGRCDANGSKMAVPIPVVTGLCYHQVIDGLPLVL
jgi:hypothetical protein